MKRIQCAILLLCMMVSAGASAQEALPRVLILGDSVYNGPSREVGKALKDQASVTYVNARDTGTALDNLDALLGENPWDVIHVNFGFADLHYKDPSLDTIRAMSKYAGGVRVSTAEQYEENLDAIITRLKATGATVVWASTTPILKPEPDDLYDAGSELAYNAIAERVMAKHEVAINDMHGFMMELIDLDKPRGMFQFKGIDLHLPIIDAINAGLATRSG